MIHLYAIVRGLHELPPQSGIGGRPIAAEAIEDVAAVVSTLTEEPPRHEAAVAHGLVVEKLLDAADAVLPVRYGERFDDVRALVASVTTKLSELRERLTEVEGCVELSVRLLAAEAAPVRAADGATYMRERLRDVRANERLVEELHAPLRRHARAAFRHQRLEQAVVHDGCYLVPRKDTEAFRAVVDEFAAAHPAATVICTGPWAPYNFAVATERAA